MSQEIKKLTAQASECAEEIVSDLWEDAVGDSPIEKLFFTALFARVQIGYSEFDRVILLCPLARLWMTTQEHRLRSLFIEPQAQLENWRVDFLIYGFDWARKGGPQQWRRLIIECDGHDFHSKTKEQARKDRSRDRWAQLEGIDIFRFTGSELWKDPWGCVDQVLRWSEKLIP